MPQVVIYGPKQKKIKVLDGWSFIQATTEVKSTDKFFNAKSKSWEDVTSPISPKEVPVIRKCNTEKNKSFLDLSPHSVRTVE